jgi:hypothetical protein
MYQSSLVRERDLADLALPGLSSYLHKKLEGQKFTDVNQVIQCAVAHKNRARGSRPHNHFKEGCKDKERGSVSMVEESQVSEAEVEVCIAEWVDNTKGKPVACSFLKLGPRKKEEIQFMFNVSKCDKLFDMLL